MVSGPGQLPLCNPVSEYISLEGMASLGQMYDDADGNVPEAGTDSITSRIGEVVLGWLEKSPPHTEVLAVSAKRGYGDPETHTDSPKHWMEEFQGMYLGKGVQRY